MLFDLKESTSVEVVQSYLKQTQEKNQTIGLTSGSFDLFHCLHLDYLIKCQRWCDVLIVGVDSDELVRAHKGEGRPVIYDSRRVAIVDALKQVTFSCIINSVEDFGLVAKLTEPDWIFKNDEFRNLEHTIVGREHARRGTKIIRDVVDYSSTTAILKAASQIIADNKH